MTPKTERKTCFLDLSAELRNSIYELALLEDAFFNNPNAFTSRRYKITEPALLRVCRQVRDESLHVFYGANTFWCNDTYITRRFLRALSPRKLAALRKVHCSVVSEFVSVGQFTRLKGEVRDLVRDFRHTPLNLDALRILFQVHGEAQCRNVSHKELNGFEARDIIPVYSMFAGRVVIVAK